MSRTKIPTIIIGANEWIGLPSLGINKLRARVDTGAKTSALHVSDLETFRKRGLDWVRYRVAIGSPRPNRYVECESRLTDVRNVKNTSGKLEERCIISTQILIGATAWEAEISLTCRKKMRYRMLLGRTAISRQALVDPGRRYLQGFPRI